MAKGLRWAKDKVMTKHKERTERNMADEDAGKKRIKRLAMAQFDEATLQGIDLYLGLLQRLVTSSVLTALALPFIVPFIMDSLTVII